MTIQRSLVLASSVTLYKPTVCQVPDDDGKSSNVVLSSKVFTIGSADEHYFPM
jgi:hypothetical protein